MAGGMHGRGACMARGHAWWGGMCGGWRVWWGGMHGRGHAWQGACMAGGVHAMHAPWTLRDMVGQCVGGTCKDVMSFACHIPEIN